MFKTMFKTVSEIVARLLISHKDSFYINTSTCSESFEHFFRVFGKKQYFPLRIKTFKQKKF